MSWLGRIFKEDSRPPINTPGTRPVGRTKTGPANPVESNQKRTQPVAAPEEILLELSLFYPRIPPEFLASTPPDLKRALKFKIAEIKDLIAQGKITVPLSRIVEQVPEIFSVKISKENDVEVFFPWKKVAHLVGAPDIGAGNSSENSATGEAASLQNQLVGHPPTKSPFTRTWSNRSQGESSAPAHLREGQPEEAKTTEQKREALHARKRAWFRNQNEGSVSPSPEGGTEAELRKEIEALRGELAKAQKERDEALAALGLSKK